MNNAPRSPTYLTLGPGAMEAVSLQWGEPHVNVGPAVATDPATGAAGAAGTATGTAIDPPERSGTHSHPRPKRTKFSSLLNRIRNIDQFDSILHNMRENKCTSGDVHFINFIFEVYIELEIERCNLMDSHLTALADVQNLQTQLDDIVIQHAGQISAFTTSLSDLDIELISIRKIQASSCSVIVEKDIEAENGDVECCVCKTHRPRGDIILSCGHKGILCGTCIITLFKEGIPRCPLCRKKLLVYTKEIGSTCFR